LYLEERRNDLACICLYYIALLHDRGVDSSDKADASRWPKGLWEI
jgi:hypothetical protein